MLRTALEDMFDHLISLHSIPGKLSLELKQQQQQQKPQYLDQGSVLKLWSQLTK